MNQEKVPFYNKIELFIIVALFTLMVIITGFTVISRYFFSFTFSWAEQLTRIMFVWVTFAGISWAGMLGAHMRVSAITMVTGEKVGKYIFWFGDIVTICFGFFMSYKIAAVMLVVIDKGQSFASIPWLSVSVIYLAGSLGMMGLAIRVIQSRVVEYIEKNKKIVNANKEGGNN
ncbi:TRAP transporter small permease [Petroclostridium sp. X23]|uniref:TRAP transporter small permease n=1 Tax=Petroclostridium sp. X23 TaxID=3045146 RepID=UPI0024ADE4A2|nr:TRAP transporter small permease [Petroclostridium sp. X23]WHH56813.1 TRAP transporter small permease [Petroclostridium sp. X23]